LPQTTADSNSLQNSLLELYGLSTLIDEHLFGDVNAFRSQVCSRPVVTWMAWAAFYQDFVGAPCATRSRNISASTERHAITQPFRPTDDEHQLYEAWVHFYCAEQLMPFQSSATSHQLILRKLLASHHWRLPEGLRP